MKLARAELTPALAQLGFRRTPRSSRASWIRQQGDRWLLVWLQSSHSNGAGAGVRFTVEVGESPVPEPLYGGYRLPMLMSFAEREELRLLENTVKVKLPAPPDWALERPDSAYLEGWRPREAPCDVRSDVWFRYWDEADVRANLALIGRVLPDAIVRYLHLVSLDETAGRAFLEHLWAEGPSPIAEEAGGPHLELDDEDSVAWNIRRLTEASDPEERGFSAMRLGFLDGPDARVAMLDALDNDPAPSVRFMAAQGLVVGRQDASCFPSIARFMRQMVEVGTREALDPVSACADLVGVYLSHVRLGFHPKPPATQLDPIRDALREALVLAERLRSRHRRSLAGWLDMIDQQP
jgi:hypothetical protein